MAGDWKEALKNLKVQSSEEEAIREDEFLTASELVSVQRETLERNLQRTLAEVEELFREKRWEDALELLHPVEEKAPELLDPGLDLELRSKAAFALGQLKRFDEAIKQLLICVQREPENFYFHSSLAYTAYNSLYAADNREVFLRGKPRKERVELAHHHLRKAQELRPDGVTNFYREAMLFKQIEKKTDKSIPLFQKAIENWEKLDDKTKAARSQERKNYVKALYHISSALLDAGRPEKALELLNKCLKEDEQSQYISPLFKHFALGKIHFALNDFDHARHALEVALSCPSERPVDFVYELLARTYLAMGEPDRAREVIEKVPEKKRRPYYRWTEADVLCALKQFQAARRVLLDSAHRDKRSAHKAYIRLAKIEYLLGNYEKSREYARAARKFFRERWNNFLDHAAFWDALSSYRLGDHERANQLVKELKIHNPRYPKLGLLVAKLAELSSG